MSLHTIIVSETSYTHNLSLSSYSQAFLKRAGGDEHLVSGAQALLMESLHFQVDFPILVYSKISFDYSLFSECCSPLDGRVFSEFLELLQL